MSVNTKLEKPFRMLYEWLDNDDYQLLNNVCQQMVLTAWHWVQTSANVAKNNLEASLQYLLLKTIQCYSFQETFVQNIPQGMQNRTMCSILLQLLAKHLLYSWMPEALKEFKDSRRKKKPNEILDQAMIKEFDKEERRMDQAMGVNRFVGWALKSHREKYANQVDKSGVDAEHIEILDDMRVLERDIIENEQYIELYYL